MRIVIVCEKREVERVVISLECEGYHIPQQPVPLWVRTDGDRIPYCVIGERPGNGWDASREFNALYCAGWFTTYSPVRSCRIQDDVNGYAQWPA